MLIGILGLGSIGTRHARNLMTLGHQVITYDPQQLSMPREAVIREADAIIIASPTKEHARDLTDVLQARKHALVEKPIAYDCPPLIAGLIMGAKTAKPNLVVATGFMLRFHPLVIGTKKLIDDGYFGRIERAAFTVRQYTSKPLYLRDGVIRSWMSHEIDLARHLLGNLYVDSLDTIIMERDGDIDQDASASFNMTAIEHEAPVTITADYFADPEIREFRLYGSKKNIHIKLTQEDEKWDQVYLDEMSAFLRAIDGDDPGPLADGYDGVAALQVVMEAREKAGLKCF